MEAPLTNDQRTFSVLLFYDGIKRPSRMCVSPDEFIANFYARAAWYLRPDLDVAIYRRSTNDKGIASYRRLQLSKRFAEENITDAVTLHLAFCL